MHLFYLLSWWLDLFWTWSSLLSGFKWTISFLRKHTIFSHWILCVYLHAQCIASTFDFADCFKKRDQCGTPLIAIFFPRITRKLNQIRSKPMISRSLWYLTLIHLIMIRMNKQRIAEGPLSIQIKLNELMECILHVLYGSSLASTKQSINRSHSICPMTGFFWTQKTYSK